jgi:hypothetical protein
MSQLNQRIPLIYSDEAGQLQEVPVGDRIVAPDMDISVGIVTAKMYSNINNITTVIQLTDTTVNYFNVGDVNVAVGGTIIVGAGVSYRVV